MKPFVKMNEWLENEKLLGVTDPQSAILSTVLGSTPHSRIVAIRKIKDESLFFFTSKQTKKVKELLENPKSSMNFSLSMQGRQIVLEGITFPLEQEENQHYWEGLPRERQLRFSSYAPFSGRKINNLNELEKTKKTLEENFKDGLIPMSEFYMGFRFIPELIIFYTSVKDSFSEVIQFEKKNGDWQYQLLSP